MRRSETEADAERMSRIGTRGDEERRERSGGPREPVEAVHAAAGNQAVRELHESGELQAQLAVARPGDTAEREAERVAEEVVAESSPDAAAEPEIRRAASDAGAAAVGGETERRVRSSLAGGRRLPASTRSFFEARFGRDFSDVRVHTGPGASEAARSIGAEAFTLGTDIAFADGAYRPYSAGGQRLIAHELTHVVQQAGGSGRDVVERQATGEYEQTGGLVTFDPGAPGGRTFTAQSAAQARELAVEQGVVEPLSESSERDRESDVIELEETTIEADMVTVVTADGEVTRLPRDEADELREAARQRLLDLLREIEAVAGAHRDYLRHKYGADVDTSTLRGKWERGMGELSADVSELVGGESGPPPLTIWGKPREYLMEATEFLDGDVYDFHGAKAYAELARIDLEHASERWNSFVDNAIQGGEMALSAARWTKSISKGVFTGLAAAYSGGGYAAVAYGTGASGFIEATTGSAQQASAVSIGYREQYDIAKLAGATTKAMVVEAVTGLVAGPLLTKFASKWAVQLDAALREGSGAAGRAGQVYEFIEEYATSVGKWYDTDDVSHALIRRDVREVLDMDGTGIQTGLELMNWAIENGYVPALIGKVVDASYDFFVTGTVETDDLVEKVMNGFFTTGIWKTMLTNFLEARAK